MHVVTLMKQTRKIICGMGVWLQLFQHLWHHRGLRVGMQQFQAVSRASGQPRRTRTPQEMSIDTLCVVAGSLAPTLPLTISTMAPYPDSRLEISLYSEYMP